MWNPFDVDGKYVTLGGRHLELLPPNAVVVRGSGTEEAETLPANIYKHYAGAKRGGRKDVPPGEWGVSVSHRSGCTAAEIVRRNPFFQRMYRWCHVRDLQGVGLIVAKDDDFHALIFLPGPPGPGVCKVMLDAMSVKMPSPRVGKK